MTIKTFQIGLTMMNIITVDTKQGYHQIKVRDKDVEKIAFFGLDEKNTISQ